MTLLVANLIIMAVDAKDADGGQKMLRIWTQTFASPLQNASSKATGATSGFFQQIWNFRSTAQQNEQLKERLAQVETELHTARQAAAETERLRALLNLNEQTDIKNVPARVIARDPSVWFNTITINRGSSSGIEVNMPVVTAGGIVGRIITVGPWASQVMLITDEKAGAGAVIGQLGSGALGSVRGRADLGVGERHEALRAHQLLRDVDGDHHADQRAHREHRREAGRALGRHQRLEVGGQGARARHHQLLDELLRLLEVRRQLARGLRRAVVPCALAGAMLLQAAAGHADSLFDSLRGSWTGSGQIRYDDGSAEGIRCNAYYTGKGDQLGLAIRCESGSHKVEIRGQLTVQGEALTGTWEERTFNAGGDAKGRVSAGKMSLSLIGGGFKGAMSVSLTSGKQADRR